MMVKVKTPLGKTGYICGFSVTTSQYTGHCTAEHVLVALRGKGKAGKLEVYSPSNLKVISVEPEMP